MFTVLPDYPNLNTNLVDVSIELIFLDPLNIKLSWFSDYHREISNFEDIFERYEKHPNSIKNYKKYYKDLFIENKSNLFTQMERDLGDSSSYILDEIVSELSNVTNMSIGTTDKNSFNSWYVGIKKNMLTMHSPVKNPKKLLDDLTIILRAFIDRHFLAPENSMIVYIRNSEEDIKSFGFFKTMILLDYNGMREVFEKVDKPLRRAFLKSMLSAPNKTMVRNFFKERLAKHHDIDFYFLTNGLAISIGDKENYLNDISNTIEWFDTLLKMITIGIDKESNKEIYHNRVNNLIKELEI